MNLKIVSDSFRKRADPACFWEAWVSAVLCRSGLEVLHHSFTIAGAAVGKPDVSDYATSFDLSVRKPSWPPLRTVPVEVKSLVVDFRHAGDYPSNPVFVCSDSSFSRKYGLDVNVLPVNYLLVSKPTGNIICVPSGTQVVRRVKQYDSSRNETFLGVVCPKTSLVDLSDFVEAIRAE